MSMSSTHFRWEDGPHLSHHCGFCDRPLAHPAAKTSCFGVHSEPCWRFHQAMFMRGKGHTCYMCQSIDEAHTKRHICIAHRLQKIYDVAGSDMTIIPEQDDTFLEEGYYSNYFSTALTKRERKDQKRLAKAANRPNIVTLEDRGYVEKVLHQQEGDLNQKEPMNPDEVAEIEKHIRYHAHVYANATKPKVMKSELDITPSDNIDFENEMTRILDTFRITELQNRNYKNRGLVGRELKDFEVAVTSFKELVIEDLVLLKKDELEIRMRRAAFLRYANRSSFEEMMHRYSVKDWKTGAKFSPLEDNTPGSNTPSSDTRSSSFDAGMHSDSATSEDIAIPSKADNRHFQVAHKVLRDGNLHPQALASPWVHRSLVHPDTQLKTSKNPGILSIKPTSILQPSTRSSDSTSVWTHIPRRRVPPRVLPKTGISVNHEWPSLSHQVRVEDGKVSPTSELEEVIPSKITPSLVVKPNLHPSPSPVKQVSMVPEETPALVGRKKKDKKKSRETERKARRAAEKASAQGNDKTQLQQTLADGMPDETLVSEAATEDSTNLSKEPSVETQVGEHGLEQNSFANEQSSTEAAISTITSPCSSDLPFSGDDMFSLETLLSSARPTGSVAWFEEHKDNITPVSPPPSTSAALTLSTKARWNDWTKFTDKLYVHGMSTVPNPRIKMKHSSGDIIDRDSREPCQFKATGTSDCPMHTHPNYCMCHSQEAENFHIVYPLNGKCVMEGRNLLYAANLMIYLNKQPRLRNNLMVLHRDLEEWVEVNIGSHEPVGCVPLMMEFEDYLRSGVEGELMKQIAEYKRLRNINRRRLPRDQVTMEELRQHQKNFEVLLGPEEERMCYCEAPKPEKWDEKKMVECSYPLCHRQFFHVQCVGDSGGYGKVSKWFCFECDYKMLGAARIALKQIDCVENGEPGPDMDGETDEIILSIQRMIDERDMMTGYETSD
ncbi:unnamed protein product [Periconia digitata]|uniref:Zinc finger PHD-type domain-containing protein n=1 Tax=Periconia digitata TaxID=1303443 RepID=A0A9W4XST0_9PLEO|nr:unnamed protein product [Periconia digitata]